MPMYDFQCPACAHEFEAVAKLEGTVTCPRCTEGFSVKGNHYMPGAHTFTAIIPCYPGAKKHKAGYVHSHGDCAATPGKIQSGYGSKH